MPEKSDRDKAKYRESVLKCLGVVAVLCMFGYESWPDFTLVCGAAFISAVGLVLLSLAILDARSATKVTSAKSGSE